MARRKNTEPAPEPEVQEPDSPQVEPTHNPDVPVTSADAVVDPDVLAVTEGADPEGTVFTRTFVVSLKGIVGGADTLTDEAFHNANKVAVMNDVINGGYRATEDVAQKDQRTTGEGPRSNLIVEYAVPVVRASIDERHPSEVPNPREMILDMGGTTTQDSGDQPA